MVKIRERGYWRVAIRPTRFVEKRVPYRELALAMQECAVSLRGWPYPFVQGEIAKLAHHIQSDVDALGYKEAWRFYESGQFVHFFSMREDWFEEVPFAGDLKEIAPGSVLSIDSTIFTFTEFFLFAQRLTERFSFGPEIVIEFAMHGLKGRRLRRFEPNFASFLAPKQAAIDSWTGSSTVSPERLIASAPELAREKLHELWERFSWEQSDEQMRDAQRRLIEQRW
ncbi:MAG: hypothetical protein HYX65_12100 [Gemmatimonadetes bacterium]|nr:hypothetical protein [Gemmatimonadota bacterium]